MVQFGQKLALDDRPDLNFWWEALNCSAIFIETIDTLTRWSYLRIVKVDTYSKYKNKTFIFVSAIHLLPPSLLVLRD